MDTREQELVRKWRLLLAGVAGVIVVGVAASILVSAWLNALNADQARMLFEATDTGLGRRDYNQLGGQIDALRWLMAGVLGYTIGAVVVLVRAAQDARIALDVERVGVEDTCALSAWCNEMTGGLSVSRECGAVAATPGWLRHDRILADQFESETVADWRLRHRRSPNPSQNSRH